MCFDVAGNLLLKLGGGEDYLRFAADAGRVSIGHVEAGPFDAGENNDWERAALTLSSGGNAKLSTFTSADEISRRRVATCARSRLPGRSCARAGAGACRHATLPVAARRVSWGSGAPARRSNRLPRRRRARATSTNCHASTGGTIRRRDSSSAGWPSSVASSMTASAASKTSRAISIPASAPSAHLDRAANAIAFALPADTAPDDARALLLRAPDLYARRGTLEGVADMVAIHSGIRPQIFEDFRARRVWQLGTTSLLGVDTQLAAATPEGFVVPRDARTDPSYAGLRGEYYAGVDFNEPVRQRTDATLDFASLEVRGRDPRTPGQSAQLLQRCTVRWEGQIRPRYSETYLLRFQCHGGLRVWVDGRPLINQWHLERPERSLEGRIVLDAGRWHALRIEFASLQAPRVFRFSWSSRHQRPEVVPRECLYSILDDHANLTAPPPATFDVGHAVVGESMPLAASEFGEGLFGDYAHLFTVMAPAGSCRDAAARAALREAIDAEKPAHTDYHLCFVEPRMRVGFQARLGIDTIVANGPPPLRLDGTRLDRDSYLDDAPPGMRVEASARLGHDTIVR